MITTTNNALRSIPNLFMHFILNLREVIPYLDVLVLLLLLLLLLDCMHVFIFLLR